MIINIGKYVSLTVLSSKTFVEEFIAGAPHWASSLGPRLVENCLKTYPGHAALTTDNFLF